LQIVFLKRLNFILLAARELLRLGIYLLCHKIYPRF
jgi:hypothetical protein